ANANSAPRPCTLVGREDNPAITATTAQAATSRGSVETRCHLLAFGDRGPGEFMARSVRGTAPPWEDVLRLEAPLPRRPGRGFWNWIGGSQAGCQTAKPTCQPL